MSQRALPFIDYELSPEFVRALRRLNPWWEGNPMPPQPHTRRHLVAQIRRRLDAEIAPMVAVRGKWEKAPRSFTSLQIYVLTPSPVRR